MSHIKKVEHSIFSNMDNIDQLCEPLKKIGIEGFYYMEIREDGKFIDLSTRNDWSQCFVSRLLDGLYSEHSLKNHVYVEDNIILWNMNSENTIWKEGQDNFSYGNGISLCRKNSASYETIGFYSKANNHKINEFYLSNLDLLYRFIDYFKVQTREMRYRSFEQSFYLPNKYITTPSPIKNNCEKSQAEINSFIRDITSKGVYFQEDQFSGYLTSREVEILYWIYMGKTSEESSWILKISNRTIDTHRDNIKRKFNCCKNTDLTRVASRLCIDKIFLAWQE